MVIASNQQENNLCFLINDRPLKSINQYYNNQNFVQISFSSLIQKIQYKAEESYTSKIDYLVLESMEHHEKYLGKRIKRGLFKSSVMELWVY